MNAAGLCLCLAWVVSSTLGARILGIFPTPSVSHQLTYQTIFKALASRGHHVTVLSTDPLKTPHRNYTDIDLSFSYVYIRQLYREISAEGGTLFGQLSAIMHSREALCEMQLSSSVVREFIKSKPQFDLVFFEDLMFHSYQGLIHHVGSPPVIGMGILDVHSIFLGTLGNPSNPAYDPNYMLPFTDHMNIWQRTLNTVLQVACNTLIATYVMPQQEALMRRHFGAAPPSVFASANNFSLYMVNRHDSLSYPRPLVPAIVNIGGLNLKPVTKRLPKELQEYVDGAEHGFIYFSLGSNVQTVLVESNMRQLILEAFSYLPQRVLFKWEEDALPGQPDNVKINKWFPQQELLAHPNIRLFVTHGGLHSTFEAVYHAVPIVGLPFVLDQSYNLLKLVTEGAGVSLDYKTVTKQDILNTFNNVINDTSYRDNMRRLSRLFKDQPETPLQRAVWWTEYVLRHKGAKHLRSAALDLAWYQYFLVDVAAILITALAAILTLVYFACRIFYSISSAYFGVKQKSD